MKIKFKNNTLEAEVVLPEKPSEVAEKIFSNEPIALADGGFVDSPEFDGMSPESDEVPVSDEPTPHPDIRISQQIDGIEDAGTVLEMFYDLSNYETLEIEDEKTQETRTFTNVEFDGFQYVPCKFAWNQDGKGGFKKPVEIHHIEIVLRGDEVE